MPSKIWPTDPLKEISYSSIKSELYDYRFLHSSLLSLVFYHMFLYRALLSKRDLKFKSLYQTEFLVHLREIFLEHCYYICLDFCIFLLIYEGNFYLSMRIGCYPFRFPFFWSRSRNLRNWNVFQKDIFVLTSAIHWNCQFSGLNCCWHFQF